MAGPALAFTQIQFMKSLRLKSWRAAQTGAESVDATRVCPSWRSGRSPPVTASQKAVAELRRSARR